MDPNNNFQNTQNPSNLPFNHPNFQFQNHSSNQSQTIPNYGFPPNLFMSSSIPSYPPYYGSMMSYSSQPPPNSFTPTSNEVVSNVGASEFPEFSTQMTLSSMGDANEAKLDAEATTHARRKNSKWTTDQNLTLLSGWIKYGADSVLGRNQSEPDKLFAKLQEGCRKDIELAFGVLQARFKIIREPARMWDITDLGIIMRSCIILHNMIVEDERDIYAQQWTDYDQSEASGSSTPQPFSTEVLPVFANHVRVRSELRDTNIHRKLQADLVKHIWAKFGMFQG